MAIYKVLDRVEARPGMYLKSPDFTGLQTFVMGYEFALIENHVHEEEEPPFFKFSEFVMMRLQQSSTARDLVIGGPGWQTSIFRATSDEQEAFKLFFQLLHEFRSR